MSGFLAKADSASGRVYVCDVPDGTSLEETLAHMAGMGFDEHSIAALAQSSSVAKSRTPATVTPDVAELRESDAALLAIVLKSRGLKEFARHATRHETSGQFVPAPPTPAQKTALPWTHSGNTLPALLGPGPEKS